MSHNPKNVVAGELLDLQWLQCVEVTTLAPAVAAITSDYSTVIVAWFISFMS